MVYDAGSEPMGAVGQEETLSDIIIRPEEPEDHAAVRRVNERAFEQPAEADLVDRLRSRGAATLSLVAVRNGEVVGHILFSPVTVESDDETRATALGLGPMAVEPGRQRTGIGSLLVEAGLERCREAGHPGVVVLGHAGYYPRFGFVPASRYGLSSEYDVPDEVFMALELREGAFSGDAAKVRYRPEFDDV